MKTKHSLLLHPLFLLSLLLLLLNDIYLKHEFRNGFTGKLSDFAGLFACFVFIISLFPSYKKIILASLSILFIWWKSSLSGSFIAFINSQFYIPIHRVVDYTDYIALVILPLAYMLKPVHYSPSFLRKAAIGCIGLVSFFSFTATTLARRLTHDNKVNLGKNIRTQKTEREIIKALEKNGLQPQEDSAFDRTLTWTTPYVKSKNSKGEVIYLPLKPQYDGVYTKAIGSVYKIPEMYVGSDTIYDLQFIITELNNNRNNIELRSFRHNRISDSLDYSEAYSISQRLSRPIKKSLKKIIKPRPR